MDDSRVSLSPPVLDPRAIADLRALAEAQSKPGSDLLTQIIDLFQRAALGYENDLRGAFARADQEGVARAAHALKGAAAQLGARQVEAAADAVCVAARTKSCNAGDVEHLGATVAVAINAWRHELAQGHRPREAKLASPRSLA